MIKTWRNGAKGEEVKAVIEYNFNVLSKTLKKYTQDISVVDWIDNSISIPFSRHGVESPTVQLFMGDSNSLDVVYGGITIDSEYNIALSTDLPFKGKVVIK